MARAAYYDVIESFTMKLGAQRIYMMNYDRRADQIFTGESSAYSGDRIQLGVSDAEDLQSMQDEAGKYRAFVANRALWIYDTGKKESTKRFGSSARAMRMIRGSIMIPTESRFWM